MTEEMDRFGRLFSELTDFRKNKFHPLVLVLGDPKIGEGVYIGAFSEVNAKGASVTIGRDCDIASFVSINCANSHLKCIGLSDTIARKDIEIGDSVFIGSHSVIKGGARIGHHCVVVAGTVVDACDAPPFSLISGNPMRIKPGYYEARCRAKSDPA